MTQIETADVGAKEAIDISIRENRIVLIVDPTGSESALLVAESEDSAESEGEREFWGTSDDGGEWRVHVVLAK